ncbi:hypothetical protein BBJ28_00011366 [Nothophytophthora sp. Chile5]|nr:hypothetical protein BBJ28_00011366 [Nothophytophthora sp. Chile5]
MAVLKLHLGETEQVGQACLRWLDAHHYSWCVLIPDPIKDAWASTIHYWDGAKIMSTETEALGHDLFWGLWLAIRLSLFSALYVPASIYGVFESCCWGHDLWWYQKTAGTLGLTPWTLALRHWTDLQKIARRREQQERISLAVWRAFGDGSKPPAPATVPSTSLPSVADPARTLTTIRVVHRAVESRAAELKREYERSLRAEQACRGRQA